MSLKTKKRTAGPRGSAPEFLKQRVWLSPRARFRGPRAPGRWSRGERAPLGRCASMKPTAWLPQRRPASGPLSPAEPTPAGPPLPGRAPRRSTEGILREKRGLGLNSCCRRREAAQPRTLCDPTDGSPPAPRPWDSPGENIPMIICRRGGGSDDPLQKRWRITPATQEKDPRGRKALGSLREGSGCQAGDQYCVLG